MPARHRISVDDFADELGKLPAQLARKVVRGLKSAAQRGKGMVVQEIDAAKPFPAVDRGELRSSVSVDRLPDGAVLFVDAPHAVFLEEGTRPHFPPLEPLIAWIKRKKLDWIGEYINAHEAQYLARSRSQFKAEFGRHADQQMLTKRGKLRKKWANPASVKGAVRKLVAQYSADDAAEQVARLLQRHIGEHGTVPRWFFRKAMMRLRPIVAEEIKRELERE